MMDKIASEILNDAYDLGFELYGIFKKAQAGDKEAQEFLTEALKQAGAPMDPAMMGADPAAGAAPAPAPAPEPTIDCPQCGANITPTPEGLCPACGFDFNTIAAAAAPSPEELQGAAQEIKTACVADPEKAAWLFEHYGNIL